MLLNRLLCCLMMSESNTKTLFGRLIFHRCVCLCVCASVCVCVLVCVLVCACVCACVCVCLCVCVCACVCLCVCLCVRVLCVCMCVQCMCAYYVCVCMRLMCWLFVCVCVCSLQAGSTLTWFCMFSAEESLQSCVRSLWRYFSGTVSDMSVMPAQKSTKKSTKR